jgi:cytochrome subunit of sulfide dehydrogenase
MKHALSAALVSIAVLAPAAQARDADPNLGRNLAATCANCHGTYGVAVQGMPVLAGLQKTYLAQRMREFKEGRHPATIMHQIAKGYSDEQIEALATYFAAQKIR